MKNIIKTSYLLVLAISLSSNSSLSAMKFEDFVKENRTLSAHEIRNRLMAKVQREDPIRHVEDKRKNTNWLHLAARYNAPGIIAVLLDLSYPVNAVDDKGETPLFKAARRGYWESVQVLLHEGADANYLNNKRERSLDIAYKGAPLPRGESIFKDEQEYDLTQALLVNAQEKSGSASFSETAPAPVAVRKPQDRPTLFNPAVFSESPRPPHNARVKTFSSNEIETQSQIASRSSAAVDSRPFNVRFDEALRTGASLDAFKAERKVYVEERTNIYKALGEIKRELTENSSTHAPKKPGLLDVAKEGNTQKVKDFLRTAQKKHPDMYMEQVGLALRGAASGGQLETIQAIFKDFPAVNVNSADEKNGLTALHWAAINCQPLVINYLLKYGAAIEAQDNSGQTALMKACQNGHVVCVKLLLQHGANVNAEARKDFTLTYADGTARTFGESKNTDQLFLESSQDKIITAESGGKSRTALHMIIRMTEGSTKKAGKQVQTADAIAIINLLMKAGADMYILDIPWKASALDWVLYNKQDKLFDALVEGRRAQLGISLHVSTGKKKA